jgi:hypothetical protein
MIGLVEIELTVHKSTPKAILVSRRGEPEDAFWPPKSQIDWEGDLIVNWRMKFFIPEWLASKHGIPFRLIQQNRRPERPVMTGAATPSPPEIFGLDESFDESKLISAHRKLMARVHPDVGGTDGLAKLLNICKDELMAELAR